MRVTRTRDQSGAAGRRHRFTQRRKRGTTLIELVLYISIATVIMTFSIGLLREEQVRRERTALAAELQQVTTALQTYVSANYETIRNELLRDTPAGSDLIRAYGMHDVVAQGYLPAIFAQTGTTPKSFVGNLQYGLVVRAVKRSESNYEAGAFPLTQTRTVDLIEPGKDPIEFERTLVDNRFADDPKTKDVIEDEEIDLEALLVTISSDPCRIVPAAHGPRIVSQSETNAAGYVTGLGEEQEVPDTCSAEVQSNLAWGEIGADDTPDETPLMATGPYGGWRLPLEPYADLVLTAAEFPNADGEVFNGKAAVQAGRFVSLLALPQRPPLSESAKIAQQGDSATRCAGVPTNTATELECQQSDLMYASLTFNPPWDSNNDKIKDKFPGLLKVNTIEMAPPSDKNGDGTNDTFPGLLNVNTLDLVPPSAVGPAQITDLLSLSCLPGAGPDGPGPSVATAANRLTVDCPETQVKGLVVTSTATVAQKLIVGEKDTTTGEITLNGENLAEKFTTRLSHEFSDDEDYLTVNHPKCPTPLIPDIAVMPVAFNIPKDGAKELKGVYTEVKDVGSTWQVKLKLSVKNDDPLTNPSGSEVVVLTGCKKTPPVGSPDP